MMRLAAPVLAATGALLGAWFDWNGDGDCTVNTVSGGTGFNVPDVVSWYYWNTGKAHVFNHLKQFLTTGINGGQKPIYCSFDDWRGAWTGRGPGSCWPA